MNKKKILFLDRDGVINIDKGYVNKYEDIEYVPGIFDLCLFLARKYQYEIIIITNQSGIGRGFYSEKNFHNLMQKIILDFKKFNITVLDYFFSPYYSKSKNFKSRMSINFFKRMPNPGMIIEACNKYQIDIKKSIFIGDQKSDFLLSKKFKNLKFVNFDINKRKKINSLKAIFN